MSLPEISRSGARILLALAFGLFSALLWTLLVVAPLGAQVFRSDSGEGAIQRFPARVLPAMTEKEKQMVARLPQTSDTARLKLLDSLAWMFRATDFVKAMTYAQQAAEELKDLNLSVPPRAIAEHHNFTGIIYRNISNYAKAMEHFTKALSIAERYGYRREQGYALNNIGEIYRFQRQYDEARQYVRQALAIFQEVRDSAGMHYGYIRLGEIAQSLERYGEATNYFQQAFDIAEAMDNIEWKAGCLSRIGQTYRQQDMHERALGALLAALTLSHAVPNDEDEQAFILIQIGKTYRVSGQTAKAEGYLQRGYEAATRLGVKQLIREASAELADIFEESGDARSALRYRTVQLRMNDSLFSEASRREIEKISVRYEMERQQRALEKLKAEQEKERFIAFALLGGMLAAAAIVLLLYRNIRAERRASAEILRQQRILEDQSAEIEMTNAQLQEQNEELATLSMQKTELLSIVSHDLKNPIGAVRGLAELLESGGLEEGENKNVARQIVSMGDRMLALVTNLLDSERIESGKMRFNLFELDIAPFVEGSVWQYRQAAEQKSIDIHFSNEATISIVKADEQALMQVLDNLVSNAVKYSPHGKNVFVRVKSSDNAVRVEVEDEGPGITAEDMKKLFGKFARLSAKPTGGEHSTGLGLSVAKKMVEAMNGSIWCESEEGKGAKFIVELPAA
jgi:signal transduction histidine kinase